MSIVTRESLEADIKSTYLNAQESFKLGRDMLIAFNNRLNDKDIDIKSFANVLPALLKAVVESNIYVFEIQRYLGRTVGFNVLSSPPSDEIPPVCGEGGDIVMNQNGGISKKLKDSNVTSIMQAVKTRGDAISKIANNEYKQLGKDDGKPKK